LLQNNLKNLIETEPLINLVIPLWAILAYLIVISIRVTEHWLHRTFKVIGIVLLVLIGGALLLGHLATLIKETEEQKKSEIASQQRFEKDELPIGDKLWIETVPQNERSEPTTAASLDQSKSICPYPLEVKPWLDVYTRKPFCCPRGHVLFSDESGNMHACCPNGQNLVHLPSGKNLICIAEKG
jgi:hypothetical protein